MTKRKLPDVLPWEERKPSNRHYKTGILMFTVLAFGMIIGFNLGVSHDPPLPVPPTTGHMGNNSNSSTVPGVGGSESNATLIVPPANVSGVVILRSTVITSGGDLELYFYNSTSGGSPVITQRAQLRPVWNPTSGWITEYWLWLPQGTWNVTSNVCKPMKLITVTVSSNGVSWEGIGYPSFTSQFTANAPITEADFECGIM